jgi:YaiO family outer membrane protein
MTRQFTAGALLLAAMAAPVQAADLPAGRPKLDLKRIAASLETEYLTYGNGRGHRLSVSAQSRLAFGDTKIALGVSQGTRKPASGSAMHATRLQASIAHDWTARLTSTTTLGLASNQPVFVTREAAQELSYKAFSSTVVSGGVRYARYFGGIDSWSWSVGASQYFRGGYVGYRFTSYDTHGLGTSVSHRLTGKFADPLGSTQLWVERGTAVNGAGLADAPVRGRTTGFELQRLQPIGGGVSLSLAARRSWNRTGSARYHDDAVRLGLAFGL